MKVYSHKGVNAATEDMFSNKISDKLAMYWDVIPIINNKLDDARFEINSLLDPDDGNLEGTDEEKSDFELKRKNIERALYCVDSALEYLKDWKYS